MLQLVLGDDLYPNSSSEPPPPNLSETLPEGLRRHLGNALYEFLRACLNKAPEARPWLGAPASFSAVEEISAVDSKPEARIEALQQQAALDRLETLDDRSRASLEADAVTEVCGAHKKYKVCST